MLRQALPLVSLLIGMMFLMMGGGLHAILIPVRGEIEGFSPFTLGWIGTSWAIGFTFGCFVIPQLVRRVGHVRTFSSLTALLAVSMLLNGLIVDSSAWIALRALSGFCFAGCYMVAESWLNERVTNDMRGSMFSIYAITTFIAMGAGQYLLVVADVSADTLFMLGAILYALAVIPTAVSKAQSPAPLNKAKLDLAGLYRNSPSATVASFLSGVISSSWSNFGPVFGQQVSLSSAAIASLLAAAMLGSVLFQFPMGKLSDLVDRRYVIAGAGVVGMIFGSIMAWQTNLGQFGTLFFISVVAYGGVIYSIYSLAVALANDYADPSEFVKVASGMLILYGLGTMVGPLMTAQLMAVLGPSGVFTSTTIAHGMLAVYVIFRTFRRDRASEEDRQDFQTGQLARTVTPESYRLDPRSDYEEDGWEDGLPPMPAPVKVELDD